MLTFNNISNNISENTTLNKSKPNLFKSSKFISISIISTIVSMLFFQVIMTKQKYQIISLNTKLSKTLSERENLEMDKSLLLSKERLRDLALNKLNMTQIQNIEESAKAQMLD